MAKSRCWWSLRALPCLETTHWLSAQWIWIPALFPPNCGIIDPTHNFSEAQVLHGFVGTGVLPWGLNDYCTFPRFTMALDKCHLPLICDRGLCHAPPICLARASFHSEWWSCSHDGSQDFWEDTHPLHYGTIRFLSLLCPTGISVSLSFYGLHHNPKVWPNPEVRWTWEEEMGCFLDTKPFLCSLSGILIPRGFMWGVWPQVSWPRCSLCRCLTQPGLHQVLLDTAMPSCPSQEDPGEASVLGEASVTGCYPTCMTVYLHMRSMKFCPCMLMCWGGGVGLHEQDLKGPLQWHWLPTVHKDWPRFHVSGQSKVSRLSSL